MNDNIVGQMGVDGAAQFFGRDVRHAEEIGDLAKGMYAGIGAATGIDANLRLGRKRHEGRFERFLHGGDSRAAFASPAKSVPS